MSLEKSADPEEQRLPDLVSFRLSASILGNHSATEISIPRDFLVAVKDHQHVESKNSSFEGKVSDGNGDASETLPIRFEATGQPQHFSVFSNREYVGSTKSSASRLVLQSAKEIKDIGTKVRARLEEEKSKRREVRVLDAAPEVESATTKRKKAPSFLSKSAKPARPIKKQKRDRLGSRPLPRSSVPKAHEAPDTSHIPVPAKESRSMYVQMHGLPLACTMNHIRNLFAGLPVKKILVLLSNAAHISQLDAKNYGNSSQDAFYDTSFRVLVKFDSAPVATLASERSGETISVKEKNSQSTSTAQATTEYSIGVTQLTKSVAILLSRLAVPISRRDSANFYKAREQIEKDLHPMVIKILWSAAARQASLAVANETSTADIFKDDAMQKDDPTTLQGYQSYAKQHNRLVAMQDDLLKQRCLVQVDTVAIAEVPRLAAGDSSVVAKLTMNAYKVLSAETDRLARLLYQARALHYCSAPE